jgi:hypothetical protein
MRALSVTPKKVGSLPVKGDNELKRTNEIGMCIPLLDAIDIKDKDITADALLTQRTIADYLVECKAHYHFTVKGNQPALLRGIMLCFEDRQEPDYVAHDLPDHGRVKTRKIWTTTTLNDYLDFPLVGQAFIVERHSVEKKTGTLSCEVAYCIASRTPRETDVRNVFLRSTGVTGA